MKKILSLVLFIYASCNCYAQVTLANTGVLYLSNATDTLYITGNFSNSSTAAFTNNGNQFISGNITNNQIADLDGSGIIQLNGVSDQNLASVAAFKNITVKKTGGAAILQSDVKVNGILHFISRNITTANYVLHVPATGSITNATQLSGWVNGKLKRPVSTGTFTRLYEIGDALAYTPVTIAFGNVTTAGNVTASTTGTEHPNIGISIINPSKDVNRYWRISNEGTVFNNYRVTFNFLASDIDAGANTAAFWVQQYNGSNWTTPAIANRLPNSIQGTGLTFFSDFVVGQTFIVLPVSFITIHTDKVSDDVRITWKAENEQNISSYHIERSADGISFNRIAESIATGSQSYQIMDHEPLDGMNYYRIRGIKHDGEILYSRITMVSLNGSPLLTAFPNPVNGNYTNISTDHLPAGKYIITMYDAAGAKVYNNVISHAGGILKSKLIIPQYIAKGKYTVTLNNQSLRLSVVIFK